MKTIMLCCNAGMSTSLLVQKMQKNAKERGLDVDIIAYPANEAMDHIADAGCVLLGPQVSYLKSEFEKSVSVPVAVIPMMDYGRMNAPKIVDDALKMMGE